MRLVRIILMIAVTVVWLTADRSGIGLGQPAKPGKAKTSASTSPPPPPETLGPGDVIVYKQGKVFRGWINNQGTIGILNDYGRTIYAGAATRMGGAELQDTATGETYTGRVNLVGEGRLLNQQTGDSLRVEIKR